MRIDVDKARVASLLRMVDDVDRGQKRALYRTMKDVERRGKAQLAQKIGGKRGELTLKSAYIKKKLKTDPVNFDNLAVRFHAQKRGAMLSRFTHRDLKKGVSVKVKRSRRPKKLPGGFIIPLRGGRDSAIAFRTGKGRWDIDFQYGPSVSQAFETFQPEVAAELGGYAADRLASHVRDLLRGHGEFNWEHI